MKLFIDSQQSNQSGEKIKVDLQYVIDNRDNTYIITPREISYYVGYYNISDELGNNEVKYSNGLTSTIITLPNGLYTLQSYFDMIKVFITNGGDNAANINYLYHDCDGRLSIQVTPPYTFFVTQCNMNLLGFNTTKIITKYSVSNGPVNFTPFKLLYVHLKQLKNNCNYFNGYKSDILLKIPVTNNKFGTLVQHKFDLPFYAVLDNTTINNLELVITDENNKIIDFHGMPVFYTLEICKT